MSISDRLRHWAKVPSRLDAIARFRGTEDSLRTLVQDWLHARGTLTLLAAETIPDRQADGCQGEQVDYLLCLRGAGANSTLFDLLRERDCELFYSELTNERNPGDTQGEAFFRGPYFEWGFQPENAADWGPDHLVRRDGSILALPSERQFQCLLSRYPDWKFTLLHQGQPMKRTAAVPPATSTCHDLPLELVRTSENPGGSAADVEMKLCQEIRGLTERLEMHRYLFPGNELVVEMSVYWETPTDRPGSAWRLRDWVLRTPQSVLSTFQHARLELENIGCLHLVVAANPRRPPSIPPPSPGRDGLLTLDWRWHSLGHQLFAPRGWQIWPPPPRNKPDIVDQIADQLWDGASRSATLVVLQRDGRPLRFAVDQFHRLDQRFETLNIQVEIDKATLASRNPALEAFEKVLLEVSQRLTDALKQPLFEIRQVLLEVWERDVPDLKTHRDRIHELLAEIDELETRQKAIQAVRNQQWTEWEQFVDAVLTLDRDLIPKRRTKSALGHANALRKELGQLWRNDNKAARRRLARCYRDLADQIGGPESM